MLKYWVWLSELKGLRNQTRLALLRRFGDPESIFYADADELLLTDGVERSQLKLLENHDLAPADRILADCQRLDIQLLTLSDAAYPGRLKSFMIRLRCFTVKADCPCWTISSVWQWWERGTARLTALPARKSWASALHPAEPRW